MSRFQNILVPVDFSDHSAAALETAMDIAKAFGAKIRLLHCYQIQPGGVSPYGIALPSGYFTEVRDAAEKQLSEWREKVTPNGIEVEVALSSDAPSIAIAEMAVVCCADLIVMGTRGLSGFKHVMLGSVAERTVRAADCPVLTVKVPESD
jgi:nucleotide-binding universal stress UspA family protein